MTSVAPIPDPVTLEDLYSGVPLRVFPEAKAMKTLLFSHPGNSARATHITQPLPPDTTASQFKIAIDKLKLIVGEANVELGNRTIHDGWYMEHPKTHDANHLFERDDLVASAVVSPGSTEEVSAIVKWANECKIPIYPISLGRNWGYGGAAPRVRGSVVVDLGRRMNKILNIDKAGATCLVEPGVTYFAMYERLQRDAPELAMDCTDVGGGSMLGNACDRGLGWSLMADHFGSHCGMEVVLPNGEIIRTGMGAMPANDGKDFSDTWQANQYGYGPYTDGIFTQGNYGIVTKMGFWLVPKLPAQSFLATFKRYEDFPEIIEAVQGVVRQGLTHSVPQLCLANQDILANNYVKRSDIYNGEGPVPPEVWKKAQRDLSLLGECAWLFYATVTGPPDAISAAIATVKREFSKIPETNLYLTQDLPKTHYLHDKGGIHEGKPALRELYWLNWLPNCAHLFFSPIVPNGKKYSRMITDIINPIMAKHGFDDMKMWCPLPRETRVVVGLMYDVEDKEQRKRAFACMREMIEECRKFGFGEYRTHQLLADQVARSYSWNDNAQLKFHEMLKDALDPNGILAPGRCGIWPAAYRNDKRYKWAITYEDGPDVESSIRPTTTRDQTRL